MFNIEKLSKSLKIALTLELPKFEDVRKNLSKHSPQDIPPLEKPLSCIATVATDGGENKLVLEPIKMQIIRVMDSRGKSYFEDFVPLSFDADDIFKFFFQNNKELQWLINEIGIGWDDIFPSTDYQKSNMMRMLRELLEWTAILRLMSDNSEPQIVIRDGLLRSVGIPSKAFDALKASLKNCTYKNGQLLVGIAKRSRVLNYLSLSISLTDSLPKGKMCYLSISKEEEKEAAPATYSWASERNMGSLYLARLAENSSAIYPIEIPDWETAQTEFILQNLSIDAQGSFPDPGYPFSLVKAHKFARIGGFEIQLLENMLINEIRTRDNNLADHVLRQIMLGKRLSLPIGDEEYD